MSLGKIARLPKTLREQLNRRLEDNEPSSDILPWLNGLVRVKKILASQFDGLPINDTNLSNWRTGGYERWEKKQEPLAHHKDLAEDARDFSRVSGDTLARGAASITAARILKILEALPPEKSSSADLVKIAYAVAALFNADQNQVRLRFEKTRVRLHHAQVTLQYDKHQRDRVALAQRILNDAQIKAIQEAEMDNSVKIELLGQRLFGELWQGKEVKLKGGEDFPKKAVEK
jgi:hypothetical protein